MSLTTTMVDPCVVEWLGKPIAPIAALACDMCGRLATDYTVADVPCPQEGGTLPWVTCRACREAWEEARYGDA